MHSCLQLTSITFCKKYVQHWQKFIHSVSQLTTNRWIALKTRCTFFFFFQSHLVIWTAHTYSFMMLFLTSSNYTKIKTNNPQHAKSHFKQKSFRPMYKKYDSFIIIIKHEKICGYNFYNKKTFKWKITRFQSSLYFLQLELQGEI